MKESTIDILRKYFYRYGKNGFTTWVDLLGTIQRLVYCFQNGNKLLICGNGGSAADANHIVGELMKAFKLKTNINDVFKNKELCKLQHALPVISLSSNDSLLTAIANDIGSDLIFAQQVWALGKSIYDILLVISTSGNSKNILCACEIAKILGLTVIGLTGDDGGLMKEYCDVLIKTNSKETSIIQELHVPIYHTICEAVENEIYGDSV